MSLTFDTIIGGFKPASYFHKSVSGTLVAGRPHSWWRSAGTVGAGGNSSISNGNILDATSAYVSGGLVRFNDAATGAYLGRFQVQTAAPGIVQLCDRIWHNGGLNATSTSLQSFTSPTWPTRDSNASANGDGIMIALEVAGQMGAAAPTITVKYTNSAGTTNRTGTFLVAPPSSANTGTFLPITLQAGDIGVRAVESIQLSTSWLSGTMSLVAYRPLLTVEITDVHTPVSVTPLSGGLPKIHAGSVLWPIWFPGSTTTTNIMGTLVETHI